MKKIAILMSILLVTVVYAAEPLFDIVIEIPEAYRTVTPGNELLTSIKLVNLGSSGRIDVILDFWITDSGGNLIFSKKETVAVETQANFVRVFDIPKNTEPGNYTIYAKITYADGKIAVAQYSFNVAEKKDAELDIIYYWITALLIVIVIIYLVFKSRPMLERRKMKSRISKIVKKRLKEKRVTSPEH